jgi:hypothetical protein
MSEMDGRPVLVLTTKITVTNGHIDGSVRVAGRPEHAFSGWAELFAVLTMLVSDTDAGSAAGDPGASGRNDC